jgi:hypothetical protein
MRKIFLLLFTAFALLFVSCSGFAQSGERIKMSYNFVDFNSIDISGNFQVELSQGKYSVFVDIPEEFEPYLKVKLRDGELHIYYNKLPFKLRYLIGRRGWFSIAKISLPKIEEIELSGASSLDAQDLKSSNLSIDCNGASKVDVSGDFGMLEIDCSGASRGDISGNAKIFRLEVSGASRIDAENLLCNKAELDISGASRASVNALDRLEIDCSGASSVAYKIKDDTLLQAESSGASNLTRIR